MLGDLDVSVAPAEYGIRGLGAETQSGNIRSRIVVHLTLSTKLLHVLG